MNKKANIDKKYTIDLTKLFKSKEEFNAALEEANLYKKRILSMKGSLLKNASTLLEYLETDEKLSILIERIYVYAFVSYDLDMNDNTNEQRKEKVSKLLSDINEATSFVMPELLENTLENVNKLLKEKKELGKYSFMFETIFRSKSHTLSEKEEKILSTCSEVLSGYKKSYTCLNDVDAKFSDIKDENGNKVPLTHSSYSKYIISKDRRVRKATFNSLYKYYKEHINTLSSLYISKVKSDAFYAKNRKYKDSLNMYLFDDNIDEKLYLNLIDVNNNNLDSLKKFYLLKAKRLGIKQLHMYDTYADISFTEDKKYSIEEAKKIAFDALNPLGKEYLEKLDNLFNTRCVDVYPSKDKRSSAYQICAYGSDPCVVLDYVGTSDDVSTLVHEMGHAMHTVYSDKTQDYTYSEYPIFLAEIASTVNEVLLGEYLYNKATTKEEKIYYLVEFLDRFKATVYRQTMFAEFEYEIHKKYENNESLTCDLVCDTFNNLNVKQFSPSVYIDENIKYEWARIPHFYSSFYVYKYATGFISALIIASKLLNNEEGFKEKYIEFLSSGGNDYPLDILKKLGIDITDINVLESAYKVFNDKVNTLETLMKGE